MTTKGETVIIGGMVVEPPLHEPTRQIRAGILACVIFAGLSLMMAVQSAGFIEGDACTHYLYARFAIEEPHFFTNVWGRPFCTAIYALPAYFFRRIGVRVTSLLIALAISALAWRIARRQGYRWPALAMIFTLCQPMLFMHSFSELTELPFALLLALALAAYQDRRWHSLALLVGLMPSARPEGFGFVVLAGLALILRRKWLALPLLLLPLAMWSFAGWWQFGRVEPWYVNAPLWLARQWPYAADSIYNRKPFLFFLGMLPGIIGPFVFPALPLGVWQSLRQRPRGDHHRQVQWIIATLPLLVLLGHSYLTWRGKLSSNAELRYMLTMAPLWALLLAQGWEWAFERIGGRWLFVSAAAAGLLPLGVNRFVYRVLPVERSPEGMRSLQAATWAKSSPLMNAYPRLMVSHPGVYYDMDHRFTDLARTADYHRKTIVDDQRGILLIWDPVYGQYNSDLSRVISADEIVAAGWVPVRVFDGQIGTPAEKSAVERVASRFNSKNASADWVVFLSPFDKDGRPTDPALRVPLPTSRPTTRASQ